LAARIHPAQFRSLSSARLFSIYASSRSFVTSRITFLRVVGLHASSKEVETQPGNECAAPGELHLVMFQSDVLASRLERLIRRPATEGESSMKKLFLAVALVVAFAAPALAHEFPNYYATDSNAMGR